MIYVIPFSSFCKSEICTNIVNEYNNQESADKKFGNVPAYRQYKKVTRLVYIFFLLLVLIIFLKESNSGEPSVSALLFCFPLLYMGICLNGLKQLSSSSFLSTIATFLQQMEAGNCLFIAAISSDMAF